MNMGRLSKIIGFVLVALGIPLMAVLKSMSATGVGLDFPFLKPPLAVSERIPLIAVLVMVIVGVALIIVASRGGA
jgi:hypothetical protein